MGRIVQELEGKYKEVLDSCAEEAALRTRLNDFLARQRELLQYAIEFGQMIASNRTE